MTTPHPCPSCVCSPSPRTCWTCAWGDANADGNGPERLAIWDSPCWVEPCGVNEGDPAPKWYFLHVFEGGDDDDMPALDAPPCPGWRERDLTPG